MTSMRTLALTGLVLLCACSADPASQSPIEGGVLRAAVLPDQARGDLISQYALLISYLEESTGLTLELVIHDDYDALLEDFHKKQIHLAWFGGLTYVKASQASDARPLVMRDVDRRFTSYYLVRADAPGDSLRDFESKRLAFGSRLSTSGHLMPRYFLHNQGMSPEIFFESVVHNSTHDATAISVRNAETDVGVANAVIVDAMFADGRLSAEDVRILESTPPYNNYVWATQADLDEPTRRSLLDAFLALDVTNPGEAAILTAQGARGYLPASNADFDEVRAAASLVGLLQEDRGP